MSLAWSSRSHQIICSCNVISCPGGGRHSPSSSLPILVYLCAGTLSSPPLTPCPIAPTLSTWPSMRSSSNVAPKTVVSTAPPQLALPPSVLVVRRLAARDTGPEWARRLHLQHHHRPKISCLPCGTNPPTQSTAPQPSSSQISFTKSLSRT